MTDKELLELAAKAAGYSVEWVERRVSRIGAFKQIQHERRDGFVIAGKAWNPLTVDGDALRLVVKLSQLDGGLALMLDSMFNSTAFAQCYTNENTISPPEHMETDPYAATRRAITRAAAEIGKAMP